MATITTDTYLDGGTARTAGENWTIQNGATLTVRTDTRWHANAPASMTGTFGGTLQLVANSYLNFDATNVRWMAYDTGTGNVPAIGTTITQGGVSGYLLGVWASYTSAPTAVGAAMPASGYLKFREVTGGQYSVGALTGIGANATEADRAGWIEVVFDSTITIMNNASFNAGLKSNGTWFSLGTTTGTPGQVIQVPTNAGGSNTWVNAIQIETSPGSGVFEWYPSVLSTSFTTANLGTDGRAKVVSAAGNGQVTIGWTGAANAGYTPASGCAIRIPNIFLRTATTAARATNIKATTTTAVVGNSSSSVYVTNVDFNYVCSDWSLNVSTCNNFTLKNSTTSTSMIASQAMYGDVTFDNICVGAIATGGQTFSGFTSGSIANSKFCVITGSISLSSCSNMVLDNNEIVGVSVNGTTSLFNISLGLGLTFNNTKCKGAAFTLANCNNIVVNGLDYCSATSGNTNSTRTGGAVISISGSDYDISNITIGENGTFYPAAPYNTFILLNGVDSAKFYNVGSRSTPAFPYDATNAPSTIFGASSNKNTNVSIKRFYPGHARVYFFDGSGYNSDFILNNYGFSAGAGNLSLNGGILDADIKGALNTSDGVIPNSAALYTVGWTDKFVGATAGTIGISRINGFSGTLYKSVGSTSYTGPNSVILNNATDYYITEMPYFCKGHTGFRNIAPSIGSNGSANIVREYQIDTGSGWNGTWKSLTAANLITETISPSVGFKLKLKLNNTTSNSYYVDNVVLSTTSTLQDQLDNMYPLATNELTLTGLQPGSEVRCYVGTDPATAVEVGGTEGTGGSTFSLQHSVASQAGYIGIVNLGYESIYFDYTYKSSDDSILIQQTADRNYNNP